MLNKYVILAIAIFMLTSLVMLPAVNAIGSGTNPPFNGYGTWIVDEGAGAFPATLDPQNIYDTASAEIAFNSLETLIFFMGENPDKFQTLLATQALVGPPNAASPSYTNFTVYFKIRGTDPVTGAGSVPFQNRCRTDYPATWSNWYLTTKDVEFSFERFMVHDYVGAATWMFYEFMLDCHIGDPNNIGAAFGTEINNAVQSNNTYVWLNIANPNLTPRTGTPSWTPVPMFVGDDGTFDPNFYTNCASLPLDYPLRILFQVIAQEWCGITSQQWVIHYINAAAIPGYPLPGAALNDWDGTTYADWKTYWAWDASASPFDKLPTAAPTPGLMCGTGPYVLDRYDAATGWSSVAYDAYWGGWDSRPYPPIPYPPEVASGIVAAGHVTRLSIDNTRNTAARIADLISGAVDTSAINRANAYKVHYPGTANGDRNGPTQDGIRLNYPIPTLQTESQHYTFIVDPTPDNRYGIILANDSLASNAIPANFFNNTHVRLAFTYLWNYTYTIATLMFGEAYQPVTCAPNGLPYVNPAQAFYSDSPTDELKAKNELDLAVFGGVALSTVGFTVDLCYYDAAGGVREASVLDLEAQVNKLGTDYGKNYHATVSNIPWNDFIPAIDDHILPTFRVGWLADYVDINDFLFPYGASLGDYGKAQRIGAYTDGNLTNGIDMDLKNAARTPDGLVRQSLYYDAEAKFYALNPTVITLVPIGRGYQRTWDQGFAVQYNALMPGIYAYWLWKWIYWRGDVDYNGKVDMGDVVFILDAFGSYIGKQGMPVIHPRWNYHCDIDGNPYESGPLGGDGGWRDRKIDMYDVSAALADFGKSSVIWKITVTTKFNKSPPSYTHSVPNNVIVDTATATGGNPAGYAYQWYWSNGTALVNGANAGLTIAGAGSSVVTVTIVPGGTFPAGPYDFYCVVGDGVQVSASAHEAFTVA